MLDFIITGLPRSATTWASVWMTGDGAHCAHDPLCHTHYEDWPTALVQPGVLNGASDTCIWRWSDWLNAQAAAGTRILILERDFEDCNASLAQIGLPAELTGEDEFNLGAITGLHMPFDQLFEEEAAAEAWEFLTRGQLPFNRRRWATLKDVEMQPNFVGLSVGPEVTRKLYRELANIALGGRP